MGKFIVFNSTHLGASHLKSGKPCQDFSLSYQSEDGDVQVAIVCDGHGGDTYVRSDVGSRLAAQITLRNVLEFYKTVPAQLFLHQKGELTAQPSEHVDRLYVKQKNRPNDMTDIDKMELEQCENYRTAIDGLREQNFTLSRLFGKIYTQWLTEIEQDANERPFNDSEKTMLGNKPITKAYGTTLQCYLRTPLYWLAFHIGDGKLMACDLDLNWSEPVPWDYRCFLNVTTSMCDPNPVPEFRYAFDGTGHFPLAVILGSDGLDDSWGTFENLATFYTQNLRVLGEMGKDAFLKELDDYLPKLSAKASRDDMSMAGVIDADALEQMRPKFVYLQLKNKTNREKLAKEKAISDISISIEKAQRAYGLLNQRKEESKSLLDSLKQKIESLLKNDEDNDKQITDAKDNLAFLEEQLADAKKELGQWMSSLEHDEAYLQAIQDGQKSHEVALHFAEQVLAEWENKKQAYLQLVEQQKEANLQQRVEQMQKVSDEALEQMRNLEKEEKEPANVEENSEIEKQCDESEETL